MEKVRVLNYYLGTGFRNGHLIESEQLKDFKDSTKIGMI